MDDAVERMEKEFDNFMKRYREMDADEFIKELEATGIAFVPCNEKSTKKSGPKITRCKGEGQGSCKMCLDNGKWNKT